MKTCIDCGEDFDPLSWCARRCVLCRLPKRGSKRKPVKRYRVGMAEPKVERASVIERRFAMAKARQQWARRQQQGEAA